MITGALFLVKVLNIGMITHLRSKPHDHMYDFKPGVLKSDVLVEGRCVLSPNSKLS